MTNFSETLRAAEWLTQFATQSARGSAARLVDAITLVSHDALFEGLRTRIFERADAVYGVVGLYAEREIRKWKGIPNRLFKESKSGGHCRGHGGGPRPVQPTNTYNPEVGSEGLLAWLITELCRQHPEKFISHPGPDEIRSHCVRKFLLLTDFIGSGRRAYNYLSAAWRIASVKSWVSGGLIRFDVVAYSSLDSGRKLVEAHPLGPHVTIVDPCPTIETAFTAAEALQIRNVCIAYDPVDRDPKEALGFEGGGALIAFAHSCPNNSPRLLHQGRPGRWLALFPKRVTAESREYFTDTDVMFTISRRLRAIGQDAIADAPALTALTGKSLAMVLLLAALRKGPRHHEAVAHRTGLTLVEIEQLLQDAHSNNWVDSLGRLTDAGRAHLAHVAAPEARIYGALSEDEQLPYLPKSLRAP